MRLNISAYGSGQNTAPEQLRFEKDWAFVALCDDGSLWLYHGSWSRIESVPQNTDL